MEHKQVRYLYLTASLFISLAFGGVTAPAQSTLTPTDAELVELLPKFQKNDALAIWQNKLVYGALSHTSGDRMLRFVDLATRKRTNTIANMPHSETSLQVSDGRLYVFGQKPPGPDWQSHLSEVRGNRLVSLRIHTGERFMDNVYVHDGEFFGVNAGYRSVSKFSPGWWDWSWEEKVGTFSLPHRIVFLGDNTYVLEARNIHWGDERISFFHKDDFENKSKTLTDVNESNTFGPIRDIHTWNNVIWAGGDDKIAKLNADSTESIVSITEDPDSELTRVHYKLNSTESCLVSLNPFSKTLTFFDHELNEVDSWDLSSAEEQFDFPRNFVIDTAGKRIYVKSAKPCFLCDLSAGSVYSFQAPGSQAEQTCF